MLKFQTEKFDYINGYTSSIVYLQNIYENVTYFKTICPTLKVAIVTSEML
jgi:phenylacetate-CoA ligase